MTFKRISTILIALTMTACITSCGDNDDKSSSKSKVIDTPTIITEHSDSETSTKKSHSKEKYTLLLMHYSSISSHFSVCRFHFSESKNIHYCHNFVFLHCQMVVTPPIKLLTMKRIIIISLLLLSLGAKAQDVIVTNSTQVIQAYRIEMGQTNIYYQLNEAACAVVQDAVETILK